MTTDELLGRISAALYERDQLLEYARKLETWGSQLANSAYNLKHQAKMSESERACLGADQKGWDEAKRTRPECLKVKP